MPLIASQGGNDILSPINDVLGAHDDEAVALLGWSSDFAFCREGVEFGADCRDVPDDKFGNYRMTMMKGEEEQRSCWFS
jgi:hypothetical protein